MDENINVEAELSVAREKIKDIPKITGNADVIDAFWEVVCGDVLLAEQYAASDKEWLIKPLVLEFIDKASQLESFDHMINNLYSACSRMEKVITGHPRLKLKFLKLFQVVVSRLECQIDRELGASEDIMHEISEIESNTELADEGKFDLIRDINYIKRDPVEWTSKWEDVIDEANRKVDEILVDMPRGMGFCHAYWAELARVLEKDYRLLWRSPARMNPGVLFD